MGMSASQARLLSLQARQSNLEYQGQQINQERTILSQQCTALYNSLLAMTVPTPPSTSDFTKIEYTGIDGASTFKLGTITPNLGGSYNVELQYEKVGNCVTDFGRMTLDVYDVPEFLYVKNAESPDINHITGFKMPSAKDRVELTSENQEKYGNDTPIMHSITEAQNGVDKYYYQDISGNFIEADSFDKAKEAADGAPVYIATTKGNLLQDYDYNNEANMDFIYYPANVLDEYSGGLTASQIDDGRYYTSDGYPLKSSDCDVVGQDSNGKNIYALPAGALQYDSEGGQIKNPLYDPTQKGTKIGGQYIPQDFSIETLGESSYEKSFEAIANTYPGEFKDENGEIKKDEIAKSFKVVMIPNKNGTMVPYFIRTSQLDKTSNLAANNQGMCDLLQLETNGKYTASEQADDCQLTFDTSGRITAIGIPIRNENGEPTGKYNTIKLEATKTTDDLAYKDAYAQYEYAQYEYDKKQQEINAKTEIIQQEDRNLELKLQRLDNERTQIKTEIEAVEKVINDNIEASYNTFSG